jgi:hypothetical protein
MEFKARSEQAKGFRSVTREKHAEPSRLAVFWNDSKKQVEGKR